MPIITVNTEPKKRHAVWWLTLLVMSTLLPTAVIGWSFHDPIKVPLPRDRVFGFGMLRVKVESPLGLMPAPPGTGTWLYLINLPGGRQYALGVGKRF
jgi:hypothetical protein